MATGSGKTYIMGGLIIYLYKMGYRNFLFFVNLSNIVEKTKINFLDRTSSKYLFSDEIIIDGERVEIQEVSNFQDSNPDKINICFSTTQGLHTDMWFVKEGAMSIDDFGEHEVVLISDEAHHLNVDTRGRMTNEESESHHSWENTVMSIFGRNPNNVLLEFTATCDLENLNIKAAYESKIIYDYQLKKFYDDQYSKDIVALRSDLPRMDRAIQALVLSQYRMKVFQDHRISIKPVVLFKASKIAESNEFRTQFIEEMANLSGARLRLLASSTDNPVMKQAFEYFRGKGITAEILAQELQDDFSEAHCISANDESDATKNQIILNSLEDINNPYRAVFEVKKLDEGWDVLNLFDIVRLYETRQSSGRRISAVTISEAQLVGRGSRYCPFTIEPDQPAYKRKYDNDVGNDLRVCETLYYHCQNDHRYIDELHRALRQIGLDTEGIVQKEYALKDSFKDDDIFKYGLVFTNERKIKSRKDVFAIPSRVHDAVYSYTATTGATGLDSVMLEDTSREFLAGNTTTTHTTIGEIAKINYAIVNKALMKIPVFKFKTLITYFPNLSSTREFITRDEYLGKIRIDIKHTGEAPSVDELYAAVFKAVRIIGDAISNIETAYFGTKEFRPQRIHDVFKNKVVNYTDPHGGGVGVSQNDASVPTEIKLDLSQEEWFAYMDNYGTTEEKAFVAYFKGYIEEFCAEYEKVFLVRNERALHIFAFEDGERFEPDYVVFLQKANEVGYEQIQIFVEPKGTHLLEKDAWKERFLLQMKDEAVAVKVFADDNEYRILGLHFFNQEYRQTDFDEDINELFMHTSYIK